MIVNHGNWMDLRDDGPPPAQRIAHATQVAGGGWVAQARRGRRVLLADKAEALYWLRRAAKRNGVLDHVHTIPASGGAS